MVVYADLSRV
jgi:hypothetical protein